MLLEMVQLSLDRKYLAKGYSNLEYDLAMVVYELGGGHCLTALQKSPFAFPSWNTLLNVVKSTSSELPCICDLLNNSEIMFKNVHPGHKPLMWCLCCLHCLIMFIIILMSSHKQMILVE